MVKAEALSVRVDAAVKRAVERAAADDRRTVAALVEKIVVEWLEAKGYLRKGK